MCHSSNMVVLIDVFGKIQRFNKAFTAFIGRTDDEVRFSALSDHFIGLPTGGEGCEACHQSYFEPKTGCWLSVDYFLCTNSSDVNEFAIVTLRDISDEIQTEKSTQEVNKDLERICLELKRTQSQIIQQEKLASIGQLAAGVAHEINNPMGFITSNLGSLARYQKNIRLFLQAQQALIDGAELSAEKLCEHARARKSLKIDQILGDIPELLAESIEGSGRVTQIVQDLKSFARADSEEKTLVCLNDCVEMSLNVVWNELKYKVTLEKELEDIPPVLCFPNRINQVLLNLLVNAGHAIAENGTISVRSWCQDSRVLLSVSDTGCGIQPENIDKLFQPFFTTKGAGRGTGLGLSISHDIILDHGGDLQVTSVPGEGTTFTVVLPAAGESATLAEQIQGNCA